MTAATPPPGWYPDSTAGGQRWWDGRSWTEFRQASSGPVIVQTPLPEGVSTGTLWIYLQTLIPLAELAAQLPYLLSFRSLLVAQTALVGPTDGSAFSSADAHALLMQYAGMFGTSAISFGLVLVLFAAWVLLAFLDSRKLERIGVVRPFHWAWSFLGVVYPTGRAVVLHRRIARGLAPFWLLVGTVVTGVVLVVGFEVAILVPTFAGLVSSEAALASNCGCSP